MTTDGLADLVATAPAYAGTVAPCFAFGVHKAGSSLMHSMLQAVCVRSRLPFTNVPGALFDRGVFEKDWEANPTLIPLFSAGAVHLGFRVFPQLLLDAEVRLAERRSVLLLRDPRDALVSAFFSYGGQLTHVLPKHAPEKFLQRFEEKRQVDIDAYCLGNAKGLLQKLDTYRRVLSAPNNREFRYETVFFDKRAFLEGVFEHFGISIDPSIIQEVAEKHDVRPVTEDRTKHIRKGYPGDHREKLKPETIERLNEIFRPHQDLLEEPHA